MGDRLQFENHGDKLIALHFDEDSELCISIKCKNRVAPSTYMLTMEEAVQLRDHINEQLTNENGSHNS